VNQPEAQEGSQDVPTGNSEEPNNPAAVQMGELEDRAGTIVTTYSVRISRYLTPFSQRGLAMWGQRVPHPYFHRPLGALLAPAFQAGLLLDALEERSFPPKATLYVRSDMFDPNHNARRYYLVNGTFAGSWEGLPKDVVVVPWYFGQHDAGLRWFADRGHRQVIAGYYDSRPERVRDWLASAGNVKGVIGVMYTTWRQQYNHLEGFLSAVTASERNPSREVMHDGDE